MTKLLSLNDMYDALDELDDPELDQHRTMLDLVGSHMAANLAIILNIRTGGAATEPQAFGGTCATFRPAFAGQPCPEIIDAGDPGGDWE